MQRVQPADVRPYADIPLRAPTFSAPDVKELRPDMEVRTDAAPQIAADKPTRPTQRAVTTLSPFQAVALFSALWLAAIGAYGVGVMGSEAAGNLSPEWLFGVAAIAVIPVALALFAAVVMNEANNLRQQALALSASTHNLLKPDEHAARNVQRLSQVIRRELDQLTNAIDTASKRMAAVETSANERMALIERTALAAQERVETATGRLGAEREKLAQFTQALDSVVLAASETLTTRLQDARAAVRTASESLQAEHGAIAGLVSTLQSASQTLSSKALETSQELERQTQRLDSAAEAAAARSEQVILRHERQRAALAETIDRLKQENDHMARAIEFQRDGMGKLVQAMAEETRKISAFTNEGARRLDETASGMAMRIVETTKLFAREADKLRTSTELTMSGLEQAVQSIKVAGDSSFDAAGRLGSVLVGLRDTAAGASQQIEANVSRLSKMLGEMPSEAAHHVKLLGQMIDEQSRTMNELNARVASAFDRLQGIELARPGAGSLGEAQQQSVLSLSAPEPAPRTRSAQHVKPRREDAADRTSASSLPSARSKATEVDFEPHAPEAQLPVAGYSQNRSPAPSPQERPVHSHDPQEGRGWFNIARRFVRPSQEEGETVADDRGNWDMKSLLAAVETKDNTEQRVAPAQPQMSGPQFRADPREIRQIQQGPTPEPGRGAQRTADMPPQSQRVEPTATRSTPAPSRAAAPQAATPAQAPPAANQNSARHMIETLQAIAIDLCRFLEDDPPHDLLKRYRNGERNVFARRLAGSLGSEHLQMIAQKHRTDREFRDTVDRYVQQFETLLEHTARNDRDNVLVETYLASQTGKVYMTLATATGRLS